MPSIVSHPAIPLALAPLLPDELRSPGIVFLGAVCSVLPDLDVVGFRFGVPYGHMLGHRGLSHSIVFALLLSACLAWLLPVAVQTPPTPRMRLVLFGFLCLSTLSHGLLDALTSGGLGVAFFAPFDNRRYFFPWRPIRVSPITVRGFFSMRGVQVLRSELQWIWLPAALVTTLTTWLRRMG
jgi:inner membrane protein